MKEEKNTVNLHQEIVKIFDKSLASIREETEREIRDAQAEILADQTEDRRRFTDEYPPTGPQQRRPLLHGFVAGQHVFTSPHGE